MKKLVFILIIILIGIVGAQTTITDELINTTGNVTATHIMGDGSLLTGITEDNSSWNESHANTLYYGITNLFGFYNSTDFSISDYFTKTNILNLNYYNSTSLQNLSQLSDNLGHIEDNSSWNESHANTLYYGITNPFGFYNSTNPQTELDPLWASNFTLYNTSWSSTYNSTYDGYNSTGLIINWSSNFSNYFTKSDIIGFNYYNSTSLQNLSQLTNDLGLVNYVSRWSSGLFDGSLYTTGADPSLSSSNSIFQILGSDGTPRFQIQNGGGDQASFVTRSFIIVNQNNTRLNLSQNNHCHDWGFAKIDCNSSSTGADFGVQDDFEAQGIVYSRNGIFGEQTPWGPFLLLGNSTDSTTIGINGSFNSATDYFCDFVSNPFSQSDEDNERWIKIKNGDYEGAIAEISVYINSSCVRLGGNPAWDSDFSNQIFEYFQTPNFIITDGGFGEFYVGNYPESKFEINANNVTSESSFSIDDKSGVSQHKSMSIITDSFGNSGAVSLFNSFKSSINSTSTDTQNLFIDFSPINFENNHHTFLKGEILGDRHPTTRIDFINLEGNFSNYITSGSSDEVNRVYYDNGATTTDITSDIQNTSIITSIFETDNSVVYIGSTTNFTRSAIILASGASKDLLLVPYYCNSSGGWEIKTGPVTDTTNGLRNSGILDGDLSSDRGSCNKEIDGTPFADTTNYSYFAMRRTVNNIAQEPTVISLSISGSQTNFILSEDYIKLSGVSSPPVICESTIDGAIYYDSDVQFHCSCKAGTGWVQMNDYSTVCS